MTLLILGECLKLLPAVDHRRGIDFGDPFQDSGFEFVQRLHSYVAQKCACHFAKQRLHDIEPGAVLGGQNVLETIGVLGQKRICFLGNVG